MKSSTVIAIVFSFILLIVGCSGNRHSTTTHGKTKRVLVFYKTQGFYHKSIPAGIAALQKMGRENNFITDTTNNADYITTDNLKKYNAVVFLSTTGNIFNANQQADFENYIRSGGGFVGIHAATDTEYDWPWYNKLIGAYFSNHPQIQSAEIDVTDHTHPSTKFLPAKWQRTDEWYNFKNISPNIHVLATLNEQSYNGGKNGSNHPIIWYNVFDGGKVFYTALGHTDESYTEPLFLQHLLGGLQYVMRK